MEFTKKILSYFFFVLFSFGYAEEISQGILENGMRYYIWPDDSSEVTIALVIKKPKELTEFPLDFFFCILRDFREWDSLDLRGRSSGSFEEMFTFSICTHSRNLNRGLLYFSERIKLKTLPDQCIQMLRNSFEEDRECLQKFAENEAEWVKITQPTNYKEMDKLFSKDNDHINFASYSLFDPTQMALIVTGGFDLITIKSELQNMFSKTERPKNDYTYPDNNSRNNPILIITDNKYWIDEDDDEFDLPNTCPIYRYFYQFDPTFRNQVLQDLLLCYASDIRNDSLVSLSQFGPDYCDHHFAQLNRLSNLYSYKQVDLNSIDKDLFIRAITQLKEIYKMVNYSKANRCEDHFLSGISESLEPEHRNLWRELESITFEEFHDFIQNNIKNDSALNLYN